MYHSRIRNEVQVTRETLSAMKERLEDAVSKILPGMPLDVVAFACTSASMVIGWVIKLSTHLVGHCTSTREDVRGVAGVALAAPFFTYVYI